MFQKLSNKILLFYFSIIVLFKQLVRIDKSKRVLTVLDTLTRAQSPDVGDGGKFNLMSLTIPAWMHFALFTFLTIIFFFCKTTFALWLPQGWHFECCFFLVYSIYFPLQWHWMGFVMVRFNWLLLTDSISRLIKLTPPQISFFSAPVIRFN